MLIDDQSLIGQSQEAVTRKLKEAGFPVRVVEEDGVTKHRKTDAIVTRRNLTIEKGIVTKIRRG